jgi:hypothetical protein
MHLGSVAQEISDIDYWGWDTSGGFCDLTELVEVFVTPRFKMSFVSDRICVGHDGKRI